MGGERGGWKSQLKSDCEGLDWRFLTLSCRSEGAIEDFGRGDSPKHRGLDLMAATLELTAKVGLL